MIDPTCEACQKRYSYESFNPCTSQGRILCACDCHIIGRLDELNAKAKPVDVGPISTAEAMQRALDNKKRAFGYTEGFEVDDNGIIQTESWADTETERGREAFENDEVFDFDAQSVYFQEAYRDAWHEHQPRPFVEEALDADWDTHLDDLRLRWRDEQKAMAVNALLAKDERPSQRIWSDFEPTAAQIVVFLIFAFAMLTLGIDTARRGDAMAAAYTEAR